MGFSSMKLEKFGIGVRGKNRNCEEATAVLGMQPSANFANNQKWGFALEVKQSYPGVFLWGTGPLGASKPLFIR